MPTELPQLCCPCCGDTVSVRLGKLRDAWQFAGSPTAAVVRGGSLYRCPACCLKFRFPVETEQRYNELYGKGDATIWTGDIPRPDWDLIVEYLGEPGVAGVSVLDFGCNTGGLLARLPDGFTRYGVEINETAAELAAQQHDARVWFSLSAIPQEQRFDVIVAVDVVEHVPNPREIISSLVRHLNDNGRLILTSGDADNRWWNRFGANWWYCFHPEHIAFISERWLDRMAQQGEFQLEYVRHFRYRHLGAGAKMLHGFFMMLYGYWPSLYLGLRNTARRLTGKADVASVLGNGVSADHLFVVLRKCTDG